MSEVQEAAVTKMVKRFAWKASIEKSLNTQYYDIVIRIPFSEANDCQRMADEYGLFIAKNTEEEKC